MYETILHPSDFTETSQIAFTHALRIALAAKAELQLLHVATPTGHCNFSDFPKVRNTLEAWDIIPKGSDRSAVPRLGIDVNKLIIEGNHPVSAISSYLEMEPSSLIVMAAHTSSHRWLSHSRSEAVSRASNAATLFVPDEASGFILPDTGAVRLKNILVPVATQPSPSIVFEAVENLTQLVGAERATVHILHVGTKATLPAIPTVATQNIYQVHVLEGNLVESIIEHAARLDADLMAMATDGHDGFMDAVRGSTTEQVLRRAHCALLAIPPGR